MPNTSLHLIQVGFLKPIIEKVRNDGININKILQQSGLNQFHLDDTESYIPVNIVYHLLTALEKEDKIHNFLSYFMPTMKLVSMSRLTDMLAFTPDVLTACRLAEENDQIIFTHERMTLNINGSLSTFSSYFVDNPLPGRELLELLNLSLIINSFKLACGHHWWPFEIHLQHDNGSYLKAVLPKDHTIKILTKQDEPAIIFHTSILKLPMLGHRTKEKSFDEILASPQLLSQKIAQLLESNALEYLPNLTHISKLSGLSSRSIQRKLKEEGTNYREILEHWRFKKSIFLLKNPTLRIKEISIQLGYTNVSNFERAFRRWANDTPQHYRQTFLS